MDRRRDRVTYYAIVVAVVNLFGNRREFCRDEVKIIRRHVVVAEGCETVICAEKGNDTFRRSVLHAARYRNVDAVAVTLGVSLESCVRISWTLPWLWRGRMIVLILLILGVIWYFASPRS
jgi:hypothetical protein